MNTTTETAAVNPTMHQLRGAVEDMHGCAQAGLVEISAIVKLALHWMESPDAYRFPGLLADALSMIDARAIEIENHIGCMAEHVGCNYADSAQARRVAAEIEHAKRERERLSKLTQ